MTSTTDDRDKTAANEVADEGPGISRGYFLFAGVLGASFVLLVVVLGVIIGAQSVIDYFEYEGAPAAPGTTTPGGGGDAAAHGEEIFATTCAACHGADASGIEGLGKDLHGNVFIGGLSDDDLVAFIEVGRPVDDPANTTGIAMPAKGGNASLTEDDLYDVAAFLRTLQ